MGEKLWFNAQNHVHGNFHVQLNFLCAGACSRTFHDFLLAEFDIEGIFVTVGARATDFSPAGSLVLLRFSLGTYPSSCSRLHHAFFFYLWCHCQLRQEIWSYCWVHIDESHMWLWNWASHVWVRDNFFVKNNQPWLDCSRFRCPLLYFGRIQWKQSKIARPSKRQHYFNAQVPMSSL